MLFRKIYDKMLGKASYVTKAVDFKTLMSEGAIIVDVRTPEEFQNPFLNEGIECYNGGTCGSLENIIM